MGRRKIEIRPIKDDRNRSVTFLKRKGGLFKKAYELGVLCSVDVAVIIFGNNKKLYEFSSGDINDTIGRFQYYAGAHEHKGPLDFAGKGGGDDEDEDEENMGSPPPDSHSPPEPAMMSHSLRNQPGLQHIQDATPSNSPPMPNGAFPPRNSTPQPPAFSRPASRAAHIRRTSSNLTTVPPHSTPPQAHAPPPNYAYNPNPPFYNQQQVAAMQRGMPQPPQPLPQHFQYPNPPQSHAQMQQAFMQEQRMQHEQKRQSMPPVFSQHPPHQQHPQHSQHPQHPQHPQHHQHPQHPQHPQHLQHPQHPQHFQHMQQPPPPPQPSPRPAQHMQRLIASAQPDQGVFTSPPLPQPRPLPAHAKSHSIFTPIDERGSLLAQHWGSTSTAAEPIRGEGPVKPEGPRSQSIDSAFVSHNKANGTPPRAPHAVVGAQQTPQRTASLTSMPNLAPSTRAKASVSEAKRPRLKVQIPSEQSDDGSMTAGSSPRDLDTSSATPHQNKNVVLPPPSPSTNNPLLSAGATGPPNPFARPAPPVSTNPHVNREQVETPLSALPSRVMDGNMLPSPSDLWHNAWYGRPNNDMLPSPLNFQPTPVVGNGPSFRDDGIEAERKRKVEEGAPDGGGKRVRT